jgi:cytochrome c oxidase cbb3-type subunit III
MIRFHARLFAPVLLGAVLLAAAAGCRVAESQNTAAGGAAPSAGVPVGPVPGPGTAQPLPSNPYRNDPAALVEGRRLFVRFNCSGCHGGRAGGGMGPSLRDPEWIYGASDARIYASIVDGRAYGMPAWGTTLPDDYVWKLTAYIHSLGTTAEPEAPQ